MKSFMKIIFAWGVSFFQTLASLLSVLLFSSFNTARRIRVLASKRRKNECIILANGPSLRDVLDKHLDALLARKADMLAVNMFGNNDCFWKIKPSYYVLTDPGFFRKTSIENVEIQKEKLVDSFNKVSWEMNLLLPTGAKGSELLSDVKNNNITILYYNYTPINGFRSVEYWIYRHNLGMPLPMNVSNAAIFLMTNWGYKDIYLLGVDHTWLKNFNIDPETNALISDDQHFYGKEKLNLNKRGKGVRFDEWLYNQYMGFHAHWRLSEYAKSRGVNVYNSTRVSLIDCYERKYLF